MKRVFFPHPRFGDVLARLCVVALCLHPLLGGCPNQTTSDQATPQKPTQDTASDSTVTPGSSGTASDDTPLSLWPIGSYTGSATGSNTDNSGSVYGPPPTALDQAAAAFVGQRCLIKLAGESPSGQPLTFSIVAGPAYGELGEIESTGDFTAVVSYTPSDESDERTQFSYRAEDGSNFSDPATVVVTVLPEVQFELDLLTGDEPLTVHGRAFTVNGEPLPTASYCWTWGSEEDCGPVSSHTQRVHTITRAGSYTVGLALTLAGISNPLGCTYRGTKASPPEGTVGVPGTGQR